MRAAADGVPNTYFVMFMKAVLFRGAGVEAAWPQFASPALSGSVLSVISILRFRKTLG